MLEEQQLEVFSGKLSDASAYLYIRVRGLPGGEAWSLAGEVRGPFCQGAHTLPAGIPLVDLGPGPALLARAVVPDPCFWSPRLPALYRVRVELRRAQQRWQPPERWFGFRFLGAAGNSLFWEGKRWVLRAAFASELRPAELPAWREACCAALVDDPPDPLCSEAARLGVLLVGRIRAEREEAIVRELRRLSRWASVGIAVTGGKVALGRDWGSAAPNLLLACRPEAQQPGGTASGAQLEFREVLDAAAPLPAAGAYPLPIVAVRRLNKKVSPAEARLQCDRLQRDLAPQGDFAGYVV